MTRTTRTMLSTIAISVSLALSSITAQAALPLSVNGQEMPSLAPILEGVTPAVVNISVSGKKITRQAIPEQFRFFFGPNLPADQVQEQPFKRWAPGSSSMLTKAMSSPIFTSSRMPMKSR